MDTINDKKISEALLSKLPKKNVQTDFPMSEKTTFRCGGNASFYITAESIEELRFILNVLKAYNKKYMVIGNGSNLLFKDSGYDGAVIALKGEFEEIVFDENEAVCGSGAMLGYISKVSAAKGLAGMQFACGIPGSLGGGVFMNAGAYGFSMQDVLKSVTVMNADGELYEYDASELELSYRHSRFMNSGEIILFARLAFCPADPDTLSREINELLRQRKEKQPLNYPSAGSFFKRPEGYFAGKLIEDSGLKGFQIGGAKVSELHAGFLINCGGASATDVLELCKYVQSTVYKNYGVELLPEVQIVE